MQLRNTKDEFITMLANNIDGYQYWLIYFGITEFFGPNWAYVSGAFCFWNEDFCRSAGTFEEL